MKKTSEIFYCAMSKWSKGNLEGKNNFMQFIEFHRFDAQPKICPYRVLQDYIYRVRGPLTSQKGWKPHSKLFVSTLTGTPAHRDTVARWASEQLTEAGIECSHPHSIRSASASKSIQLKEPVDSVMSRLWLEKNFHLLHSLFETCGTRSKTDFGPSSFARFERLLLPSKNSGSHIPSNSQP